MYSIAATSSNLGSGGFSLSNEEMKRGLGEEMDECTV
jgi:hypothetical protein